MAKFLAKVVGDEEKFKKEVKKITSDFVHKMERLVQSTTEVAAKVVALAPALRRKLKGEADRLILDFDNAYKEWLTRYIELLKSYNQIQSVRQKKLSIEAIRTFREVLTRALAVFRLRSRQLTRDLQRRNLILKKHQRLRAMQFLTYPRLEKSFANVSDPLKVK